MLRDTIHKIETIIRNSKRLPDYKKQELENLISLLRAELNELESVDGDEANTIASFAKTATHESLREDQDKSLFDIASQGVVEVSQRVKVTHPKLAEVVDSLMKSLSNLGV